MLRRFEVAERSMEPAFRPGDLVVASRLRDPATGTPVVVEHPNRAGFWLLKRIVAGPGDAVEIADGVVTVNGVTLREPWTSEPTPGPPVALDVPGGRIFVLSDARTRTLADSRTFGPVDAGAAYRVRFTYWPPSRVGAIRVPRFRADR
jgi:signal peptidase I